MIQFRKLFNWLCVAAGIFYTTDSMAQSDVGPITLNPGFGTGGIVELNFTTLKQEPTLLVTSTVKQLNIPLKIMVGLKLYNSDQTAITFGLQRFNFTGQGDPTFASNGLYQWNWNTVSYPLYVINKDSTQLAACGYSGTSVNVGEGAPAAFLFSAAGVPDSLFGGDGHVTYKYDDGSGGEFTFLKFIDIGYMVALGYTQAGASGGQSGFGAMWFKKDGSIDSSYGINGKMQIQASIQQGYGYFMPDLRYMFIGVSTNKGNPTILLARLTKEGQPDSTFGTNGLLNTGIIVRSGGDIKTVLIDKLFQYGRIMVCGDFENGSDLPFSILRLDPFTGAPDSTYGINGYSIAPVISKIHPKGMILSNDGSCLVAGQADSGLGMAAMAKFKFEGGIDSTFANAGVHIQDLGQGQRPNSFTFFNSIGEKKFACVGMIGSGDSTHMFLAGFMKDPTASVSSAATTAASLSIYPNPSSSVITITAQENIRQLSLIDAAGRVIYSIDANKSNIASPYFLVDVAGLATGSYRVLVETATKHFNEGVIITH